MRKSKNNNTTYTHAVPDVVLQYLFGEIWRLLSEAKMGRLRGGYVELLKNRGDLPNS